MDCLERLAKATEDSDPFSIRKHICFQLAVCKAVGFGNNRDESESQEWLSKSGQNSNDIDECLDWLRSCPPSRFWKSSKLSAWTQRGRLFSEPPSNVKYYRKNGQLIWSHLVQKRELSDWTAVLGVSHWLVLALRNIRLCSLLNSGHFSEAEDLSRGDLNRLALTLGPADPYMLATKTSLVRSCLGQGKFDEAESLLREVISSTGSSSAESKYEHLYQQELLATIYSAQNKFSKAISLREVNLRRHINLLGNGHIQTINCMLELQADYTSSRRLSDAIEVNKRLLTIASRMLVKDHEITIVVRIGELYLLRWSQSRFANIRRLPELELLDGRLMEDCQRVLGREHFYTMCHMFDTIVYLASRAKFPDAIDLAEDLLKISAENLGEEHTWTMTRANDLTYLHSAHKRYLFYKKIGLHDGIQRFLEKSMIRTMRRSRRVFLLRIRQVVSGVHDGACVVASGAKAMFHRPARRQGYEIVDGAF